MITTQVVVPVSEVTMITVKLTPEGQERRDRLQREGKCLGCEREMKTGEQTRCGQCDTCYPHTRNKINEGKVTLKELVRDGYMLVPKPGGRPPKNDYTRKLSER